MASSETAVSGLLSIRFQGKSRVKLTKWKIKEGDRLGKGSLLLVYQVTAEGPQEKEHKLKGNVVGTVVSLVPTEGEWVEPEQELVKYKGCSHATVMKDMCAECGTDLRQLLGEDHQKIAAAASVSMIHSVPELRVSRAHAEQLGKADERRLLKDRKLVLLVDLDQTLIHTTNEEVPSDLEGVQHFQLYGANTPWYHTKFRPHTTDFLEKMSSLYELHICTFGARMYAHKIASLLDPSKKFFSHRILSRDECFDPTSKTGNLKALFPCGDSLVCIIDDREDVWSFSPNLVAVKPYLFFRNTGDINSPYRPKESALFLDPAIDPKPDKVQEKTLDENSQSTDSSKSGSSSEPKSAHPPESDTQTEPIGGVLSEAEDSLKRQNTEKVVLESDEVAVNEVLVETKAEQLVVKEISVTLEEEQKKEEKEGKMSEDKVAPESELKKSEKKVETQVDDELGLKVEKESKVCETSVGGKDEVKREEKQEVVDVSQEFVSLGECSGEKVKVVPKEKGEGPESGVMSVASVTNCDDDDYLLYLEDILRRIYDEFYREYDDKVKYCAEGEPTRVPELKEIIPKVKRQVLKGVNLVFSGVIPTNNAPEKSKLWSVAKSLGANVTRDVVMTEGSPLERTTHVVAAKLRTAKVNRAMESKKIWVVNPLWLYCCAERWEHVEEKLFPLEKEDDFGNQLKRKSRLSPDQESFMSSGSEAAMYPSALRFPPPAEALPTYDPVTGKRIRAKAETQPQALPVKINREEVNVNSSQESVEPHNMCEFSPLSMFTKNDLRSMDREVEDACSEGDEMSTGNTSSSSSENDERGGQRATERRKRSHSSSSESSVNSECPKGWSDKGKSKKVMRRSSPEEEEETRESFADNVLPSESSSNDGDFNSIGSVDEEMAAAVEREFLGQ